MARLPPAERVDLPAFSGKEKEIDAAVRAALEPVVRPFSGGSFAGGEYAGCDASLVIGAPGSELVGRAWQGRPGLKRGSVAALARFGRADVFVSTDRACLPPAKRLPVWDRYEVLLEPEGDDPATGLRIAALQEALRLVPLEVAIEAMETLRTASIFQEVMEGFGRVPYGSRLVERRWSAGARPGLFDRLKQALTPGSPARSARSRHDVPPPPPLDPPPGQLKFYLDRWLRPGFYRFGELFLDARELKDQLFHLDADGLAFTVEFIEGTTARHVHWRFRGTLLRAVLSRGEVVVAQRFVI